MLELIPQIQHLWRTQRQNCIEMAQEITQTLRKAETIATPAPRASESKALERSLVERTFLQLKQRFDAEEGGFGRAPKFPLSHHFLFLLRYARRTHDPQALQMVEVTLDAMRRGGIFDHLGFGFHRYATDRRWRVPHFEKMLYDQALLAIAYSETALATGKGRFARAAREIFQYVMGELRDDAGGFYAAEDADSEGEEGRFYQWTEEEVRAALGDETLASLIRQVFNLRQDGNYLSEATQEPSGRNIFYRSRELSEIAAEQGLSEGELSQRLEQARQKLVEHRRQRPRPLKDDKILTDWNGLMIAALAIAGRTLQDPAYTEAAKSAATFILERLRTPQGRLLHRYRQGQGAITGLLDDYAFFIWGLLELLETTTEVPYLKLALEFNQQLLEHFADEQQGGFFLTPDDGEPLLTRTKTFYDGALPSGNAVALWNLLRLGRLTGQVELEQRAQQLLALIVPLLEQAPILHSQSVLALDYALGPSFEVVIAGDPQSDETQSLLRALQQHYLPHKVVLLRPTDRPHPDIVDLVPSTATQVDRGRRPVAYVCEANACYPPTTDVQQMLSWLGLPPAAA
jgi:uncharacterized protein YyaL (SSP411 family)